MPLDLMSIAEGASPGKAPPRRSFGSAASSAASSTAKPAAAASSSAAGAAVDPLEAMRQLDALQLKHSSSSSLTSPKPPATPSAPLVPVTSAATTTSSASAGPTDISDASAPKADWTCKICSKHNLDALGDCTVPGSMNFCPTCGGSSTGKPNRLPAPASVTDEWSCHCGEFCPESFKFCVECGLPAGARKPPPPDECGGCGEALGDSFEYCPECGTAKGLWNEGAKKGAPAAVDDDWTCAGCGEGLPADFAFCIQCGGKRPS